MAKRKPTGGRLRRKSRLRKKALTGTLRILRVAYEIFESRIGLSELLYGQNPKAKGKTDV